MSSCRDRPAGFLAYFLIPWTAINLVDFSFVHHGEYKIADIFHWDGIYHRFNWRTLAVYALGVLVEIPFMDTIFYVGTLSKTMNGADISWMTGLAVSAPLYYRVSRIGNRASMDVDVSTHRR